MTRNCDYNARMSINRASRQRTEFDIWSQLVTRWLRFIKCNQ